MGDKHAVLKAGLFVASISFLIGGALGGTSEEQAGHELAAMAVKFPWSEDAFAVNYSLGYETFIYTSAYSLDIECWYEGTSLSFKFFKYFEEGLWYGRDSIVVFDPEPPGGENNTFLDLCFNSTPMMNLEDYLCDAMENPNIIGFVLGDEWPRGLNREEITVQKLARHNQTYHDETGRWMMTDPSLEEKKALADWFYDRSIEAWNRLARNLRRRFPDVYMGTDIDLVWEADYTSSDVASWRCTDWWQEVDLAPYNFVVTHYFTKMDYDRENFENAETKVDEASIIELRDALEFLLDPRENITGGVDVFLLLGAHCSYPSIITPMQMVREWNTALEYRSRLAGVGWFTFDLWSMGDSIVSRSMTSWADIAPLKENRLLTVKWLGRLSKYGVCTGEVEAHETILIPIIVLSHLGPLLARYRNRVEAGHSSQHGPSSEKGKE